MSPPECLIRLPANFRASDITRYHLRDPLRLSEQFEGETLRKGLVWLGNPACLSVHLMRGEARVRLAVDNTAAADIPESSLTTLAYRILGMTEAVSEFECAALQHQELGPLVLRQRGLRVAVTPSPFEALTWAITGQQISVAAAVAIRRRLIETTALRHSSGLWCHPDAVTVSQMAPDALRKAGFSATKTDALLTLSRQVASGTLDLDQWLNNSPIPEIRSRLLAIRGIGPWTVDYTLLRGYGWLDGSLHGDAAVRRAMGMLLKRNGPASAKEAQQWLAGFSPWRALAAAHLWSSLALQA